MIALSVKGKYCNFLSAYRDGSEFIIDDYGTVKNKTKDFNEKNINNILKRKSIARSRMKTKRCIVSLETKEVFFNQLKYAKEVDEENFLKWHNESMFGKHSSSLFSDCHYKTCTDEDILSVYIEKSKQKKYYDYCSFSGLNLKALSIGIFSAEYFAREVFEAKKYNRYMIWSIDKDYDEIMIIENGSLKNIMKLVRLNKNFQVTSLLGDPDYASDCGKKINKNFEKGLKNIDFVDKIYMYQKSPYGDMKKINKKNKEGITILNPLTKMKFLKKTKFDEIETSYLSEMGYIFKY